MSFRNYHYCTHLIFLLLLILFTINHIFSVFVYVSALTIYLLTYIYFSRTPVGDRSISGSVNNYPLPLPYSLNTSGLVLHVSSSVLLSIQFSHPWRQEIFLSKLFACRPILNSIHIYPQSTRETTLFITTALLP